MENQFEHIDPSEFVFVQKDTVLHDGKLESKARGYFADALIRFKKNKSSVVAAFIIAFLILYALIVPIVSPYTMDDKDKVYVNYAPYWSYAAENGWGFLDGSTTLSSQNETAYIRLQAIGAETGMNPVISLLSTTTQTERQRGKDVEVSYYSLKVNRYYLYGIAYRVLSYEEFEKIQQWQNETGIQVIFPYVETKDIQDITNDPSIWYQVKDAKGTPVYGGDGTACVENLLPAYSVNQAVEGAEYHSLRIEGDPGNYIYSIKKSGSVQVRLCYYNYYQYLNGHEPTYLFGTNEKGQDLFTAVGTGARFSLIFAVLVSVINLTIGAIYGAIQGYYGGKADMLMDRIADVLSGLPFIVCVTLFQLHLAQKVGIVPSFLFAYVLTGWIGTAALTRKQFYRFKGQEYVLAARTLGASDKRLMFKHIFPNSLGTIITSSVLMIPGVINSETNMTYLGIINLSDFAGTSIGELLSQGQTAATTSPHALFFPALFLSLLLICFNLFGNGLRDAFNPSNRGVED